MAPTAVATAPPRRVRTVSRTVPPRRGPASPRRTPMPTGRPSSTPACPSRSSSTLGHQQEQQQAAQQQYPGYQEQQHQQAQQPPPQQQQYLGYQEQQQLQQPQQTHGGYQDQQQQPPQQHPGHQGHPGVAAHPVAQPQQQQQQQHPQQDRPRAQAPYTPGTRPHHAPDSRPVVDRGLAALGRKARRGEPFAARAVRALRVSVSSSAAREVARTTATAEMLQQPVTTGRADRRHLHPGRRGQVDRRGAARHHVRALPPGPGPPRRGRPVARLAAAAARRRVAAVDHR